MAERPRTSCRCILDRLWVFHHDLGSGFHLQGWDVRSYSRHDCWPYDWHSSYHRDRQLPEYSIPRIPHTKFCLRQPWDDHHHNYRPARYYRKE